MWLLGFRVLGHGGLGFRAGWQDSLQSGVVNSGAPGLQGRRESLGFRV